MAQALGGTYGLSHGAMNALCLPPALDFNRAARPDAVARFGAAIGAGRRRAQPQLARLGGFGRLRDFGVPEDDLPRWPTRAAAGRQPGEPASGDPGRDRSSPFIRCDLLNQE